MALVAGELVLVINLRSASGVVMNGSSGTLVKFHADKERWETRLASLRDSKLLKAINLAKFDLPAGAQDVLRRACFGGIGSFDIARLQLAVADAYNEGICLLNKWKLEKNEEEAVKWYNVSAHNGNTCAQDMLAVLLHKRGDNQQALGWAKKAADVGSVDGKRFLAALYKEGAVPDKPKAFQLYLELAQQGDIRSQCSVGECYRNGIGIDINPKEAVYWFRSAAEQGCAIAQHNLGGCYLHGFGVNIDANMATHWFDKASLQGLANSQHNMANRYMHGFGGVQQDRDRAFRLYEAAADQGHLGALANLGKSLFCGDGVKQDQRQGYKHLLAAAEKGHAASQAWIGMQHLNSSEAVAGECIPADERAALEWLQKASAQGHAGAYIWRAALTSDKEEASMYTRAAQACGRQIPAKVKDLSHGDAVVFDFAGPNGSTFQHWALFDAQQSVFIERTGTGSKDSKKKFSSSSGALASIVQTSESDFRNRCRDIFKRIEWEPATFDLVDRSRVVERARARVGEDGYSVLERNCEHFVMECLFAECPVLLRSLQADSFKLAANWKERMVAAMASCCKSLSSQ